MALYQNDLINTSNPTLEADDMKNCSIADEQSKCRNSTPGSARRKHIVDVDQELQEKCKGWSEIRCQGSLPDRRSYHTLRCRLIIYGGFDIREGDWGNLFVLDLCTEEPCWNHIQLGENVPKSICRHTSVVYDKKLWVLGGESKFNSVNDFFTIDLETFQVNHLKMNKDKFKAPRFLDSHTAIVQESGTEDKSADKMIVFGGYNHSQRTNQTYIYSFINNAWEEVNCSNKQSMPCERTGHSAVLYEKAMYIFGGIDQDNNKLNDLWKFDIDERQWSEVKLAEQADLPQARSGHGSAMIEGKMYLFGGIMGMTHQLNDLWAYDFASNTWKELHDQLETWKLHSPLRNKKYGVKEDNQDSSGKLKVPPRGRPSDHNTSTFYEKKQSKIRGSHSQNPIRNHSKGFKSKKLSKNRHSFIDLSAVPQKSMNINSLASPTTVALKNTLLFRSSEIGLNSSNQQMSSRKKSKVSVYRGPKQPSSGLIEGFPPCPRDGLAMISDKANKKFYIFGGDRYQMAYNDLYEFDVNAKF